MKAFLAIVWREIHERRALLAAAAVAALLPVLAPLLPSTGSNPAEDIREAVLLVIAGGLLPIFALLLGVGFIGRDLGEGRLGFYYSQPVSGPTIWFGRLGGVMLLLWAVEMIIVLPTILLSSDPIRFFVLGNVLDPFIPNWLTPVFHFVASFAIVLVAHAIGIVWRARSAWLVVDTIALLVVAALGWAAVSPFLPMVAPEIVVGIGYWVLAWVIIGLTVAGAVQVAAGRIEPRRCHRFLSVSLWTILVAATGALLAWSVWVRSANLDDVDSVYSAAVSSGEWVVVAGTSPGRFDYVSRFIYNIADGRSLAIGPQFNWGGPEAKFSADGSTAVWLEAVTVSSWSLLTADLAAERPAPVSSGVALGTDWGDIAIAPDGSSFAVLEGRTLAVYRRGGPAEQLAAVHIGEPLNPIRILFDDPATVRVVASSKEGGTDGEIRWWLLWFDVPSRRMIPKVEIDSHRWWRSRSRDGRTEFPLVEVQKGDDISVGISDSDTGEVLRDLEVRGFWSVRVLDDGRILVLRDRDGDDRLELFEPTGEIATTIDLPEAGEIFDGPEVGSNQLLLGLIDWVGEIPNRRGEYRTIVVDLSDESVRELSRGSLPVLGRWGVEASTGSWGRKAYATRLLYSRDGALFLWHSHSGELEQLLPLSD